MTRLQLRSVSLVEDAFVVSMFVYLFTISIQICKLGEIADKIRQD